MILPIFAAAAAVAAAAPASTCPSSATPDALVCRALQAQSAGEPATAAQAFEDAAKASPANDPRTASKWAAAGNLWIEAEQPGKAAFDLDRALAIPGLTGAQRGEVLLDRARAAESQGELKIARARLNEAASAIPGDPFYWYFSAALAIREGDPATAQTAINKALSLAPADATILFEAGHVADLTGNDDQARSYWMRAAANDPTGPVGKAAAKAIEMLGVTPTVKSEVQAPR
ncbi:tetratricopeptide (TPR) repeat protein [Sphingomonas sp. F9_3S_D5_B_2]